MSQQPCSSSSMHQTLLTCLICSQSQPKNSFLAHIAEHLHYSQHKCQECGFESVTVEEMADHEGANPDHLGQLYALRNPYMDRVCRFIYNDCDFGEKSGGGLEKVLKRRLLGTWAEEEQQQQQQQTQQTGLQHSTASRPLLTQHNFNNNNNTSTAAIMKPEDCSLPSPRRNGTNTPLGNDAGGVCCWPAATAVVQPLANSAVDLIGLEQQQHFVDEHVKMEFSQFCQQLDARRCAAEYGPSTSALLLGEGQQQHHFVVDEDSSNSPAEADLEMTSALERFVAQQQQSANVSSLFKHEFGCFLTDDGQQRHDLLGQGEGEEGLLLESSGLMAPSNSTNLTDESKKGKKKYKEVFENVQCLKCGQWVKGRGICLLYHMNTRHLKLPLYRCKACPRDFFYVTDTTAKNHIRSFHANDLSLLENNYPTLSRVLLDSRREYFGPSKSERRAGMLRAKKMAGRNGGNKGGGKKKKGKAGAKGASRTSAEQKQRKEKEMLICFRERPQSGAGASNSSHVRCNQCGDLVPTIYSSQLGHINTKHLHLSIYACRLCDRRFESLSSSAVVMHVKSIHGKSKAQAESEIEDRRDECLKQLNEHYRTFFA